jgi:cell division protein FtsN
MAAKRGRQAYRGDERKSWPAWLWLILGALLGIVLSLGVLYGGKLPTLRNRNLPQPNPEATAPKESEQALADDTAKKTPAAPKSVFDFYSVLPEKEVVIPDAELSAKAKAEQQRAQMQAAQAQANAANPGAATPAATATPPIGGARYMLQVTATSDPKAAEEYKARLALLGFSAKVYTSISDGKTWHRVRLGPYASAIETQAAQKALSENNINAIGVKEAN